MAECQYCRQEMHRPVSCVEEDVVIGNQKYAQVPHEQIPYCPGELAYCGDCKTPVGGFHHPGCDMERCPRCGGQLISCGCSDGRG